jgi:two-component system response regulator FlrC
MNIGRDQLVLSDGAKNLLKTHSWPGNVRELENIIQRAVLLADGDQILAEDLELEDLGMNPPMMVAKNIIPDPSSTDEPIVDAPKSGTNIAADIDEIGQDIDSVEREHILKVLAKVDGNRTKAVEILGISARALRYKLKSYKEAGFIND